jgi:hypothetical protein
MPRDMHLYLTPEDEASIEKVKALMVAKGFPESSLKQQAIVRFALAQTAQKSKPN